MIYFNAAPALIFRSFYAVQCGVLTGTSGPLPTIEQISSGDQSFQRPAWSTGILIPCGFIVGISAAVLIWRGGERTKRVAEVQERLRAALTTEDEDDNGSNQTASYPPSRRRDAEIMAQLPEGLEENEVKVDEEMTVPPHTDVRYLDTLDQSTVYS
ncbi:hypothetical protein C0991_012015 [Blastosporella zonata]|nr:hypothetical protein C0991_012015 [Blastosporella zonata]